MNFWDKQATLMSDFKVLGEAFRLAFLQVSRFL
jgi:hypothetical protein